MKSGSGLTYGLGAKLTPLFISVGKSYPHVNSMSFTFHFYEFQLYRMMIPIDILVKFLPQFRLCLICYKSLST